jgi:hypothetical protein
MGSAKNVIQTADVFAAALEHVNRDSALELMQQVMQLTEAANHETNVTLSTQINTVRNDLQIAINTVSDKTDQALAAAKILEGAEIDQLIQAFKDFIGTSGIQQLIQDSMVSICGKNYQLGSVLETLARADRDAKVELLHNAMGTELTGVRYTLTDGVEITLDANVVFDNATGVQMYNFTTADWRGLPASFNCTYRRMQTNLTYFGKVLNSVKWLPVSHTNLVFDLCGKFKPEVPVTGDKLVPDLSNLNTIHASQSSASSSASAASASAASASSSAASASSAASSSSTSTTTTVTTSTSGHDGDHQEGRSSGQP